MAAEVVMSMTVPKVELMEASKLGSAICPEDEIIVGIFLEVTHDISGSMMFLIRMDSAHYLVNKLMGVSGPDSGEFSEMELSALKEIGNIITGAYLNSLSMLTNMKIIPSVPDLSIDMAGAILSVPAIEFGALGDRILLIQTQFTDDKLLDGFFILVPDLESYDKIMASLGCN